MFRGCIDPAWRWRAVRDDLLGDRRLVALGVLGIVLLVVGVALESAALGAIGVLGAGLLTASVALPIVTKMTIGTVSFEGRVTTRDEEIASLAARLGPLMTEVARWLSAAGDDRVRKWVEQALALAYHDGPLVPRRYQDAHALCLVVRAVRGGVGMDDLRGPDAAALAPVGGVRAADLLAVPFEGRAALALRRLAQVDDTEGASILHCTAAEFAAAADGAAAVLAGLQARDA